MFSMFACQPNRDNIMWKNFKDTNNISDRFLGRSIILILEYVMSIERSTYESRETDYLKGKSNRDSLSSNSYYLIKFIVSTLLVEIVILSNWNQTIPFLEFFFGSRS